MPKRDVITTAFIMMALEMLRAKAREARASGCMVAWSFWMYMCKLKVQELKATKHDKVH